MRSGGIWPVMSCSCAARCQSACASSLDTDVTAVGSRRGHVIVRQVGLDTAQLREQLLAALDAAVGILGEAAIDQPGERARNAGRDVRARDGASLVTWATSTAEAVGLSKGNRPASA